MQRACGNSNPALCISIAFELGLIKVFPRSIFYIAPAHSYNTVIHFYFGADLISVISVQAFFTYRISSEVAV